MNSNLLNVLDNIILKKKQEIVNKDNILFQNLNNLELDLEKVISNPELIKDFDLDKLNILIVINNQEYRYLKFLKRLSESEIDKFKLTVANKKEIINYFSNYCKLINIKKNNIILNNSDYLELQEELNTLNLIKNKLLNSKLVNKNEFIFLSNLLKENIVDINEYINILKELSINICSSYEKSLEEEINLIKITNLDKIDLENLFQEFNLDFNNLKLKEQEKLLLYGSLDNIRNILNVLKDNNITVDINKYSKKISEILLLSNYKNVSMIINNIKEDLNNDDQLDKIFLYYLNSPSLFINGLKKYEEVRKIKNKKNNEEKVKKENLISGSFNNYLLNRKYFLELGIDNINKLMKSCSSSFTYSNVKVKSNVEAILSYGIKKEKIFETLSCLSSSMPLDIIDQFIEADFYDYIINAPSRLCLPLDSPELIKLINAKKLGFKENEMFGFANGVRRQKYIKFTNLKDISGFELVKEKRFKVEFDSIYSDISFEDNIIDKNIIENDLIKILDNNFKNDELTYKFNEIIISRYKVLRYFNILVKNGRDTIQDLKNVLFKNTIITKSEYDVILSCFDLVFNNYLNNDINQDNNNLTDELNILNNNYFIKFLDNNFLDNEFNYDFDGVKVIREDVLKNFLECLKKKEVSINPLNALFKSIIKNKSYNQEDIERIINSLNKASLGKIGMGSRL